MSKKHQKVWMVSYYIEKSIVLVSAIIRCVPSSAFALLVRISIVITSSAVGLTICGTNVVIKN